MRLLECFIYGFVSGAAELLPISSPAHQKILRHLFGSEGINAFHSLLIHISVLAMVILIARNSQPVRSVGQTQRSRKRHRSADMQHIKTAIVPLLIGVVFYFVTASWHNSFLILSCFLLLNGIILYIPSRMMRGNKNAAAMTGVDSLLIGSGAAIGAFPGISRTAGILCTASARGADASNALRWSVMLSIPALMILTVLDLISLGSTGAYYINFFGAIFSMAGALIGTWIGYAVMRFLAVKSGFSWFSYYSWGAALFSFILYLTV